MAIVLKGFAPPPCAECGMEAVHHFTERWSLFLESLLGPITRRANGILLLMTPLTDRLLNITAPAFVKLLTATGLGIVLDAPDAHASETTLALWEEARRRGIDMREMRILGLPRRLFTATYKGKSWVFEGLPRPARAQPSLHWIDDKAEMKRRFMKEGFPVAKGGVARTERQALRIFNALRHAQGKTSPVVVKPHEGSNGRHVTVHIETEEELRRAFRNAHAVSPFVIVEEELAGPVFRATLLGGKLAAVLRRDPPHVTGDGESAVRDLVQRENENPLRRGPVFAVIDATSASSERELKRQGLAVDSVPPKGQKVFFHFKVNWGVGGTSHDVTAETHPANKKLFEEIGAYLKDDIIGIDFMAPDITRSFKEQERCGVIELNSLPLIGNHHFPYEGPAVNVAGAVWDMVFPQEISSE